MSSDCASDLVGAQAAGADVDVLRGPVDKRLHTHDVGLPGAVGAAMGVGDLDTESHALAADVAFRHCRHLLYIRAVGRVNEKI